MLICWMFGHRYEYELRTGAAIELVCIKCGRRRLLVEQYEAVAKVLQGGWLTQDEADRLHRIITNRVRNAASHEA